MAKRLSTYQKGIEILAKDAIKNSELAQLYTYDNHFTLSMGDTPERRQFYMIKDKVSERKYYYMPKVIRGTGELMYIQVWSRRYVKGEVVI